MHVAFGCHFKHMPSPSGRCVRYTPRKHISLTERHKLTFDHLSLSRLCLRDTKTKMSSKGTEIKGCRSPRASQRNVKVVTEEARETLIPLAVPSSAPVAVPRKAMLTALLRQLPQADRAQTHR